MAEHLKQAAKEMENAPPPLRKETGKDALPPEQRALQSLLAADASFAKSRSLSEIKAAEVRTAVLNVNNKNSPGCSNSNSTR